MIILGLLFFLSLAAMKKSDSFEIQVKKMSILTQLLKTKSTPVPRTFVDAINDVTFNFAHMTQVDLSNRELAEWNLEPLIERACYQLSAHNKGKELLNDEECRSTLQIKELNLSHNKLTKIDAPCVYQLKHLRSLDISDNQIKDLSLEPGKMPKMSFINAHGNPLQTVRVDLHHLVDETTQQKTKGQLATNWDVLNVQFTGLTKAFCY